MVDLKKFPKVRPIGHPETDVVTSDGKVYVLEKMDGANFRFKRDGDRIVFGSRNVVYKNEKDIPNAFEHAVKFVRERVNPSDLPEDKAFFGEAMHEHTLEYDWPSVPSVLGYAAYDGANGKFLPYPAADNLFRELSIPTAPLVEVIDGDEIDKHYSIPDSEYRNGVAEGVVFWDKSGGRAKLRSEEFKEKHDSPTASPQDFEGHGRIVNEYCTKQRIDKRIDDLLDEGHDLGRPLMGEGLPMAVARDIFEEGAHEIVGMSETVDLKEYRSLVAKRCLSRIDERLADRV